MTNPEKQKELDAFLASHAREVVEELMLAAFNGNETPMHHYVTRRHGEDEYDTFLLTIEKVSK